MLTLRRLADRPYRWEIGEVPLIAVANRERRMPAEFISADGFHITDICRAYLQPLIEGEDPPPSVTVCPTTCTSAIIGCPGACRLSCP